MQVSLTSWMDAHALNKFFNISPDAAVLPFGHLSARVIARLAPGVNARQHMARRYHPRPTLKRSKTLRLLELVYSTIVQTQQQKLLYHHQFYGPSMKIFSTLRKYKIGTATTSSCSTSCSSVLQEQQPAFCSSTSQSQVLFQTVLRLGML